MHVKGTKGAIYNNFDHLKRSEEENSDVDEEVSPVVLILNYMPHIITLAPSMQDMRRRRTMTSEEDVSVLEHHFQEAMKSNASLAAHNVL